jgi:hypothetical protein
MVVFAFLARDILNPITTIYTAMQILATLFGSAAKVKIMRLFLFNPDAVFDVDTVASRSDERLAAVRSVVSDLAAVGLVRKKMFIKTVTKKVRGKKVEKKAKVMGYTIDSGFKYLLPLQNLLIRTSPLESGELMRRIGKVGKLKLVISAGIFTQDQESRLDLLVVGDNLRMKALERAIHSIETEVGKEIRYSAFETPDFKYRLGMYDKLVREILEYPHENLLDKLGITQ